MEPIILSALGAFCLQALQLTEVYNLPKSKRPDFKDVFYWLPYFINPFIGGVLGYIYFFGKQDFSKVLALHVGASAPLILRTLANQIPKNLLETNSISGGGSQKRRQNRS